MVIEFWNMLPQDTRSFIISVAASIASTMISREKSGSKIEKELQAAFEEGFKYFVPNFGDNCSYFIKGLLGKEETKNLFRKLVKNEDLSENKRLLGKQIESVGIDTSTVEGFDFDSTIRSFLEGFTAKAETSEVLLPFLNLRELKKVVKLLQETRPLMDPDALKEKYYKYLKEKYSYMSFKGLSEGKLISVPLKELYTRLIFTKEQKEESDRYSQEKPEAEINLRAQQFSDVQISDILKSRFAVITGGPGAGKSTLLKYIALAFVEKKEKDRIGVEAEFIPILFPIAAFADACKKPNPISYSIDKFIPEYFEGANLPNLSPLINDAIEKKKALFLIDGLDEVSDEFERKKMVEKIREFIISNKNYMNRFIITCRIASYTRSSRFDPIYNMDFAHFNVLPFNDDQIHAFLLSWYRLYHLEVNKLSDSLEIEAQKSLKKMLRVIQGNENIHSIATNPLMITILALIEHEGDELPKDRAELYKKCLVMLAGRWERIRSLYEKDEVDFKLGGREITEEFIINFLGPVAMEMHQNASPDIDHTELKSRLSKKFDQRNKDLLLSKEQADDFIRIMKEQSGILEEIATGRYDFMHQTFREYLSARVLTELSESPINTLGANLLKPEWREVILLTASSLSIQAATKFIKDIMEGKDHKSIFLAGECVIDTGRDKVFDYLYDELIGKLENIAFGKSLIEEKVQAGETLGWLGDSRDLKAFIEIEGGKYKLENVGTEEIKSFEIGQYPVTNDWFEEFIKGGGYENMDYWSKEGRKWRAQTKVSEPRLWNDRKWKSPNSPVVGVSWYEADAFTRWLTLDLDDGYTYRLLNEKEWQAAAAGHEGREYPWVGKWDKAKCNNREIKIEKTSPVGIFIEGNTPDGISDMSGNVWDWTLTDYHSRNDLADFKLDQKENERQRPVLRGGSWFFQAGLCRCADRFSYFPVDWSLGVGFRCARTVTL